MSRERFIIELEAAPSDGYASPAVRLRRALKCLLRSFGLKCVSVLPSDVGQLDEPKDESRK
jgi:hypothetical protein